MEIDQRVADGIRGTRVELGEIGTDECGDEFLGFVEVPVLMPAAEDMAHLRRRLDEFMFVRSVVIDRVAAQRAVAMLSRRWPSQTKRRCRMTRRLGIGWEA